MYPTFTNNYINQDTVSVHSGNSTITNSSFSCRNGLSHSSRMIPRSNSTSDLFDTSLHSSSKTRKRKPAYKALPDLARTNGSFMSSSASLASRDWNNNYVTSQGYKHSNSPRPKILVQHTSPYPQKVTYGNSDVVSHTGRSRRQHPYPLDHNIRKPHNLQIKPPNDQSLYLDSTGNRLNPIIEGSQLNRSLTPYQLQRKQMKNSFQFPNGENFTPRNKLATSLPKSNTDDPKTPQVLSPTLPRSSSLAAINARNHPMLQPLSRSQSMNSVALKCRPPQPLRKTNNSPVTSGSSRSSYNSMKEHASNNSTNPSSEPSTNNSTTALTALPNDSLRTILIKNKSPSDKPASSRIPNKNKHEKKIVDKTDVRSETSGSIFTSDTKKKVKSKSKVGNFFKKLFSSSSSTFISKKTSLNANEEKQGKRKRNDVDNANSSAISLPISEVPAKSKQKFENIDSSPLKHELNIDVDESCNKDKDNEALQSEADEDDEDDDILMDTDLVFDSLLLKANENHPPAAQKQKDLQKKLAEIKTKERNDMAAEEMARKASGDIIDPESQVDHDLISEFSKLGSMINQFPTEEPQTNINIQLPQRSSRRPIMNNKDMIKSFYQPSKDNDNFTIGLLKRLKEEWTDVHLDVPLNLVAEPGVSTTGSKYLRFSNSIYVKDTWSPFEYQRSDKKFIKNRRRMMQLENEGFVQAIKVELNEFKRNDMIVHQESAKYTHFFL